MAEGLPMYLTVVIIGQIVYGRFFIPAFLHHCLPGGRRRCNDSSSLPEILYAFNWRRNSFSFADKKFPLPFPG
jgi:hypothetical protein